jgi:aspartate/methionine/tyrosine aminotransferase
MAMHPFERRNEHFDRLIANTNLRWMGQNTNHYPAHPDVRRAMIECIENDQFHAYAPPVGLEALRRLILEDLGLPDLSAIVTDGAVSGLYHLCRTLCAPGDSFVTTDPTWAWPMAFSRAAGAEVVQIPIYGEEHGYRLAPRRLRAALNPRTKIIYIVDPNNPLGTACTADEIEEIAAIAREAGAYLIHDCTYRDFAHGHHLAAKHYPERTITVWSFSKWLGFAGLRVGALIAHPDVAAQLAAAPPNNLGSSILAQRGAIAGLKVKAEWFGEVLQSQRRHQARVKEAAEAIHGLKVPVYPSNGNFLIIECDKAGVRPDAIVAALDRHNIQVRQGSYHTKAFGDRFIKVSVTVPDEWVDEFCRFLPLAVEEARGQNAPIELF